MKKKLITLPLLSLGLLLAGCNGDTNPSDTSISIENESSSSISEETITSENETSSEFITSDDTTSFEEESKSVSSEEESLEHQLSVKEQLIEYLSKCVETQNYSIFHEELARYYLPNAYYCDDYYASASGYAEDENGIFSYTITNGVVGSVNYLKNDNNENIKGLYDYSYGNYSWIEKENYLVNSFAPVSLEGLELTRVKNSKVEAYTVPFDTLCNLLTEMHLQSFVNATISGGVVKKVLKGTCTLTLIEDGFNIAFYSSAAFTTFNYEVKNIGKTEIPEITDYIASGGVQTGNLYTQIVSIFENNKYKVTFSDGKVRYIASNYVVNIDGDNISGYYLDSRDYVTYPFVVENNQVVIPETNDTEVEEGEEIPESVSLSSYIVNPRFLSNFELVNDKLVADSYLLLQGSTNYFTSGEIAEGNYIGYAEISANIVNDEQGNINASESIINFLGKEYDGNQGVLLDTTYEATYSEFGVASYKLIEDYLNSLN